MTPEQKAKMLAGRNNAVKTPAQNQIAEIYNAVAKLEIEERLASVRRNSPKYAGIMRKAYSGKSLRAGINAKCLDCCCWQRIEVEKCSSYACPLWSYRPYQP